MNVLEPADLDASQLAAVSDLVTRSAALDGHPPLPEPLRLAVAKGTLARSSVRVLLAFEDGTLVGSALVAPATDGSQSLHVVVDPDQRAGAGKDRIRHALIEHALASPAIGDPVRVWAMQATDSDDVMAAGLGFAPERDLLQMRVGLPLPATVLADVHPLSTRPFEPGRDEEIWLDVNNRAFAGHPEQGNWTLDQLRERLAADWVDLRGFLVADAPDGKGIIGSCWTKIHRSTDPELGEIYVISVDPDRHGKGWGKSLTVAGLQWLTGQGITVGMLYTDAENKAAVSLYTSLGFTVDHVDRSYVRLANTARR